MKKNILGMAVLACALAGTAAAQSAVPKQIKIVVPFSAGASNDAIARAIAPQLAEQLKTIVIVENRVGAAGVIGSEYVAKSAGDGATLLLTSSSFLTSAATQAAHALRSGQEFRAGRDGGPGAAGAGGLRRQAV